MPKIKQIYGPLHFKIEEEQRYYFHQKKFYSDSKSFLSFAYLAPHTIEKIQAVISTTFPEEQYPKGSLKRYLAVLEYLMNSKLNKDFDLFDYKIAFLIQALDPELAIYFGFLSNGYSIHDSKEVRSQKAPSLIQIIIDTVGTFDAQFLKYEEVYFQRVLKCDKILSYVNKDCSTKFLEALQTVKSFDTVNPIELQVLDRKAQEYSRVCANPESINTLCFNMDNPNNKLELYHIYRKAIFAILVLDPNLNCLRIYSEESNVDSIKERMIQEMGFYHAEFVRIERLYHQAFYPEMSIGEWSY